MILKNCWMRCKTSIYCIKYVQVSLEWSSTMVKMFCTVMVWCIIWTRSILMYEFKNRRSIGFGNSNTALVCLAKGHIEQSGILEENCLKSAIRDSGIGNLSKSDAILESESGILLHSFNGIDRVNSFFLVEVDAEVLQIRHGLLIRLKDDKSSGQGTS